MLWMAGSFRILEVPFQGTINLAQITPGAAWGYDETALPGLRRAEVIAKYSRTNQPTNQLTHFPNPP